MPKPTSSKQSQNANGPSESDIIVNKSLLALAQLQRTVQSWLQAAPQPCQPERSDGSSGEIAKSTELDLDEEEDEADFFQGDEK